MSDWCTVPKVTGPTSSTKPPPPEQIEARERYLAAKRIARLADTEEDALELCRILGLDKPSKRYKTPPVSPDYQQGSRG